MVLNNIPSDYISHVFCNYPILAGIIYWQAKEIHRVLLECPPEEDLDLSMLKHISPITWENVILYGEYVINRKTPPITHKKNFSFC